MSAITARFDDTRRPAAHDHTVLDTVWRHIPASTPLRTCLEAGAFRFVAIGQADSDQVTWALVQSGVRMPRTMALTTVVWVPDYTSPSLADAVELATQVLHATPRPALDSFLSQPVDVNGVCVYWTGLPKQDTVLVGYSLVWKLHHNGWPADHYGETLTATSRGLDWTLTGLRGEYGMTYVLSSSDGFSTPLPDHVSGSRNESLVAATQMATATPQASPADPAADDAAVDALLDKPADHLIRAAEDVTDALVDVVVELVDSFTADGERVDWLNIWERLERLTLEDGRGVDLGDDLLSPALRKIKRRVRAIRAQG